MAVYLTNVVVTLILGFAANTSFGGLPYEDSYRLCYVRGPEAIIVALAEQLS